MKKQMVFALLLALITATGAMALTMMPPKNEPVAPLKPIPLQDLFSEPAFRIVHVNPSRTSIYAELTLEFPKSWGEQQFSVRVDGKDVNVRQSSGRYSEKHQTVNLLFFPGKPGNKQVTVVADVSGKPVEAKTAFVAQGTSLVRLIRNFGENELITAQEKLRLAVVNGDAVKITFNGAEVRADSIGQEAKIFTFQPAWIAGKNLLRIDALSHDGKPVSQNYSFVYADAGVIRQGEKMFLYYEDDGLKGKSGPWHDVTVSGDAVQAAERGITVNNVFLTNDGWLFERGVRVLELTAVKPGSATVRIIRQARFLATPELEREIMLKVLPSGE